MKTMMKTIILLLLTITNTIAYSITKELQQESSTFDQKYHTERKEILEKFREERATIEKSGKASKKGPKPAPPLPPSYVNPCCQICPAKFMASLEIYEATPERKKRIYENFQRFHAAHYQASSREKKDLSAYKSLDSFLEMDAKPKVIPPPAVMMPGEEPCCALCPGGFDQAERMFEATQKGGVVLGFLEQEETITSRSRKSGSSKSGKTAADDGFCCNICSAQFYAPREFFDYENIMDAQESSFVELREDTGRQKDTMSFAELSLSSRATKSGTSEKSNGLSCCVACKKTMFSGVAPSKEEIKKAADAKSGKSGGSGGPTNKNAGFSDPAPRNPDNLRSYSNAKGGGGK